MFAAGGIVRAALISLVLVGIAAVLIVEFGPNEAIGIMRIKVVNDTDRAVRVQPCWDFDCLDYHGLASTIIPPHRTPIVASKWEDDVYHQISVGVLKPNAIAPNYQGCVVGFPALHKAVAVFFVSKLVKCPDLPENGGGGSG